MSETLEQIERMIKSEVDRRVAERLAALRPELVLPIPVEPPRCGFVLSQRGGDADLANGKHFAVYVREEENSKVIQIQCPTFLRRGGLGIRVEKLRSMSY